MAKIIFDLDDTLYDLMEPFQKAHEEVFGDKTGADCEKLFMASRIYSDEAFYLVRGGKLPKEEEFAYRIQKTYQEAGLNPEREETDRFEERYRYYQKHLHVPEVIRKMLDLCVERETVIGILTNGTAVNQGKKIQVLGMERWFPKKCIFISDEVGATKPDVRAFQAVEKAMGLEPEDTWFIGDTFEVDVDGAHNAGWHIIWFNHRKRKAPEGARLPDLEVRTAEKLLETVEKLTK